MHDARDFEIRIWYSAAEGDRCYIAQVVDWPGIMAHGETRESAAREIQIALEGAIELARNNGQSIPVPKLIAHQRI